MSDRPNVLLVGITGYANEYLTRLEALHQQGRLELSDAVVINADQDIAQANLKRLERLGTRIHRTWNDADLQAAHIDLVGLPVGIPAHRELTDKALALGASVLLEKPAAGCVSDWEAMCEAERAAPGFVAVGFQHICGRFVTFGVKSVM